MSPRIIVAAAVVASAAVGLLMAGAPGLGVGLTLGLVCVIVVLSDLTVGLAVWAALLFLSGVPALGPGPLFVSILVVLAWLATLRGETPVLAAGHPLRRPLGLLALLLVWIGLSIVWAPAPDLAADELRYWCLGGLAFVVVGTAVSSRWGLVALTGAFVVGAVLAVAVGLLTELEPATSAVESSSNADGRLGVGGEGDPNYLAAMLVPAVALAAGLLAVARGAWVRLSMIASIGMLSVGVAATQSRGGILAAVAMTVGALVLLRGLRPRIALALVTVGTVLALWFVANPMAFERVTEVDGGGTGRTELWEVGWEIAKENPLLGIGLNNFQIESSRYARRPGELEFVEFITERPLVVHNVFLQLLVETGVIGLTLFVLLVTECLRSAWAAGRMFERRGDRAFATFARAILLGVVGTLVASVFLSNGGDQRLWLLLALGPALLAVARADTGGPSGSVRPTH